MAEAKNKFSVRSAACDSLIKIEKCGRYSNIEIDSSLKNVSGIPDADRALYTRLVYGVIERQLTLDHIIMQYSAKAVSELDTETLTSLRLGIYQLVYTDRIPDFAAVSETVDTAPRRSRGFVNGVLRSFLRAGKKYSLPEGTSPEALSVRYSTSADICKILSDSYGAETAEHILEAFFAPQSITLRINTLKCTPDEALSMLDGAKRGLHCADTLTVPSFGEAVRDGIEKGLWFVQDEASRITSSVLGAMNGEKIADVCAAPGGKSFSVAIDMENSGALHSFDLHENKLSLIKKTAARLGITCITTEARDARHPDEALVGKCDRVLCDAPCSGIGVLGKKPEIRYKAAESAARLPEIQYGVLCGAAEYVKDGGVLVYSTCTLNRAENEDVVKRFLDSHSSFKLVPFTGAGQDCDGMLTFMPHVTGTDGFFASKMIKITKPN